ncbi:TB2/DP1/HVA22-related protein [Phaffia rhodozyma]|uniref:TB2/DP1/HVA22-related protein n=1 Tax=Phaffia rhodozyma TaxID=264483 RepID=A0A0F7SMY9_PHARH|nr:TB2/DP1/HVA22-related protein [Phaffia rhodozyma]
MFLINTVLWYGVWFLNVHASHKALKPPRRARKLVPGRSNADRKREVRLVVEGWIVWTAFIFAEGLTDRTLYYLLPFYSETKSAFMIYLILSRTIGTHAIYINLILPTIHQFSHPFGLLFSLIYVLTEAMVSLLPLDLLSSLRSTSYGQRPSNAPPEERLSIAEGKNQVNEIVRGIHEMQGMVRPLSRRVNQFDGQNQTVGVRKRRGEFTVPTRPSITKNKWLAEGSIRLETTPPSTRVHVQTPSNPLTLAPLNSQSVFDSKKLMSIPRLPPATYASPAHNQAPIYPSLLLKPSPHDTNKNISVNIPAPNNVSSAYLPSISPSHPSVPSSPSSNFWALSPSGLQQSSSSVIPNAPSSLSNDGTSSPLTLPVLAHAPLPAQRTLRKTPARKAKLNRIQNELHQISPPKFSLSSKDEANASKRSRTTKVVKDFEPGSRRKNVETLEDEEIKEVHSSLLKEDNEEKLEGQFLNEVNEGSSGKRKRGGVVRTKTKVMEHTEAKNEEMEVELSLEGGDIKRYLPSIQSTTRSATQQRPTLVAPNERSTRFAPYSRQSTIPPLKPTTVSAASRRKASVTTLSSPQLTTSTRNSTTSRSKLTKTNASSSSRAIQTSVPPKVPEVPVLSTTSMHKNAHVLPTRSSTRSVDTVSKSNAASTTLSPNVLSSKANTTSKSSRPLVSKPRVASTRSSALKRTTDLTAIEAPINLRFRRTNGSA